MSTSVGLVKSDDLTTIGMAITWMRSLRVKCPAMIINANIYSLVMHDIEVRQAEEYALFNLCIPALLPM